jgi:hypothetical protein
MDEWIRRAIHSIRKDAHELQEQRNEGRKIINQNKNSAGLMDRYLVSAQLNQSLFFFYSLPTPARPCRRSSTQGQAAT